MVAMCYSYIATNFTPKDLGSPGNDVMIFKIFSPTNSVKKFAFLTQNKAKLWNILIKTLFFEKNVDFFAKNCRKPQKIVIIKTTPGYEVVNFFFVFFRHND
jgi:hypothetical protein